jgi:hypothetical protein
MPEQGFIDLRQALENRGIRSDLLPHLGERPNDIHAHRRRALALVTRATTNTPVATSW